MRMKGPSATVWVICLTCAFPGALPFKSEEERPDQMVGISTDDTECFSDYMALRIPKSRVRGLKQWLSRTLNVPVKWGSMERLNSFLARCGYFLHPDSTGNYIFQARYTACFVQQEKANYLLEIRIFQKGIKSFGQSDRYILKCPVIASRLSQESILCGPDTIQVSRPMPQGNARRQSPWLLSLRGELVASLEDASLLGLYVETNTTAITILGPRQQLLQRKEVMNTSVDFLSLWMVSGYFAYSLEAMCPLVSSQPGTEVLVQIPKQGLGLVKRGSRYTEALTLRNLRVSQSNSFTVTENRDFVVVSIPASNVLQSQQCQEAQGDPRMQSFYRIDLSLEYAEMVGSVHWTVENFFHCADQPSFSGVTDPESFSTEVSPSINKHLSVPGTEELKSEMLPSLTTLNTVPSSQPSSLALFPSTPSVGMELASSFSIQAAGSASSEGLQREPLGNFALDGGQREQAVGTNPTPCLQLSIFSSSPEEYLASARSKTPFGLGCLTLSNPTAPSNSTNPTPRASTSAIVSFQESNRSPQNLQSKDATLTVPLPGLWPHSLTLNHNGRRPPRIPMTVPSNGGSPKNENSPEATAKIPMDVSKAVSELSDANQQGQALLQMSTILAAGQNDSRRRHPGTRGTNTLLSKNFSGGVIYPLLSFTTLSLKKEQELGMKPQAVSVVIRGDSIISSVPGTMTNQQGPKDPTHGGTTQISPSVMFQDDPTPTSVTAGANSQAPQLTLPAPRTSAGQLFSVPALPQLASFRSTKYLEFLVHLQKEFATQSDGLREIRPGQDLAQLPEHSNQLRRLMEGSRTETDVNPKRESEWVSTGLQGGSHMAGEYLATNFAGGMADTHHGQNQTQEVAGLLGELFSISEITVTAQRDAHFLQNRTEGILVTNLPLSGAEETGQIAFQAESQSNSPLSWRDVTYTNRGRVLRTSFSEEIVSDSSITHQEWPKTDGPTSPIGHVLRSQRALGQAALHPFLLLPKLLPEKQLSDPLKRTLDGIRGSTEASSKRTREQLPRTSESIRTQGPGSVPAGTRGWVITPPPTSWPSWTLHPESYLSQATGVASPSISNPTEPGDPFPTGH